MPPKKVVFNPFLTRARARSIAGPGALGEDEKQEEGAEFRDAAVHYLPIGKQEAPLELSFRCTHKLLRGDTIIFRLAGFKGQQACLFTFEPRQTVTDSKVDPSYFRGFWGGEVNLGKGAPPTQAITIQVRHEVEANTLVVLGVPEACHIMLPEKLPASSQKLKIEGSVKAAVGGKVPKTPIVHPGFDELKKKKLNEIDGDVEEVKSKIKEMEALAGEAHEEEIQFAREVTVQEVEQLWEEVRHFSELRWGLQYHMESHVFNTLEELIPVMQAVPRNFLDAAKKRVPLAFHRELAANLGVRVGTIVVLEDILFSLYGHYYLQPPESPMQSVKRSALLALRLWTCESHDICRLLNLTSAPCIYRDVHSAIRSNNQAELKKWANFIGVLSSTCGALSADLNNVPTLYHAVKDLPTAAYDHLKALPKGSIYCFPNFTTCSAESPKLDTAEGEAAVVPDSAAVFEIEGAMDGVELVDVSQYPEDREWLMPMFAMYHVESVTVNAERNGLLIVKLKARGSLMGRLMDNTSFFTEHEDLRKAARQMVQRVRAQKDGSGDNHAVAIAKLAYMNLKLNALKSLHADHVVHQQYLEKYQDAARQSQAKMNVETGVKWLYCNAAEIDSGAMTLEKANWEKMPVKTMVGFEAFFLKRTRAMKQFPTPDGRNPTDGVATTIDFGSWMATEIVGVKDKTAKYICRRVGRDKIVLQTHPFVS